MQLKDLQDHVEIERENDTITVRIRLPFAEPVYEAIAICEHFEGGEWVLIRAHVPEEYRDKGIGSFLINKLLVDVSKSHGFSRVVVQSYSREPGFSKMWTFLSRLGFEEACEGTRTLEWRRRGPILRLVPAQEIQSNPTLSLLATDYVKE